MFTETESFMFMMGLSSIKFENLSPQKEVQMPAHNIKPIQTVIQHPKASQQLLSQERPSQAIYSEVKKDPRESSQ